jgi:hypothetical protein
MARVLRKLREELMKSKTLILCIFSLAAFFMAAGIAHAQNNQAQVVLEITRKGAGMTFPLKKQVYFRLYEDGRLEYETPPVFSPEAERASFDLVMNQTRLEPAFVTELIRIAEQPDFLDAPSNFRPFHTWIDAAMLTTLVYKRENKEKRIVITNYNPKHEEAGKFYPASLQRLLQRVVELRPKTEDEKEYGTGFLY